MAQQYRVAAPQKQRIRPAFLVKKLEGKRTQTIYTFDAKGKKQARDIEVDAGYLVKFPIRGHSIRVANEAELKRLGFDQTIPLLDNEGDAVGAIPNAVAEDGDDDTVIDIEETEAA